MKLKKNVAVSEAGLLFNPVTGESFSVNPIGVEILNLLREERTDEQIRTTILAKYSTDKATFEKDYQDFIGNLSHNNLLEGHTRGIILMRSRP
jgi:DNA phosphorothioation-dependent restriction protein DptG